MKGFVMTVVAQSKWTVDDIVSAVNGGMREHATKTERLKELNMADCAVLCHRAFELQRQDDNEAGHQ